MPQPSIDGIVRILVIRLGELFNDICLLLSTYSPLFLIGYVRAEDPNVRTWLLRLGVIFTVLLAFPFIGARFRAKEDYRVTKVDDASGEVAAYVATYILPLLIVGDKQARDFEAYALFLAFIGIILIRGNLLHYNPWVFIFGRRIYTVRVGRRSYYLIAANAPAVDTDIAARPFADRFLLA
jgi:hypothetical protein